MRGEQRDVIDFMTIGQIDMIGDFAAPGIAPLRPGELREVAGDVLRIVNRMKANDRAGAMHGWPICKTELAAQLIIEEAGEVVDALAGNDPALLADGLADLLYVTLWTAVAAGVDLAPVFDAVHQANMDKFPPCAACMERANAASEKYRNDPTATIVDFDTDCAACGGLGRVAVKDASGKVSKPEGWKPPDIATILRAQVQAAKAQALIAQRAQAQAKGSPRDRIVIMLASGAELEVPTLTFAEAQRVVAGAADIHVDASDGNGGIGADILVWSPDSAIPRITGWIQPLWLNLEHTRALLVNEDGRALRLVPNEPATVIAALALGGIGSLILGDCVLLDGAGAVKAVLGSGDEGDPDVDGN